MKNPLLESLINDIILLGEAGKTPQQKDVVPKGLFPGVGGNYYSDKELTQYAGKVVGRGTNRKWVPAEQQPKMAGKKPTQVQSPQAPKTPRSTKPKSTTTTTPQTTEPTGDVIVSPQLVKRLQTAEEQYPEVKALSQALRSGDPALIQAAIDGGKFYITTSGKLAFKRIDPNRSTPEKEVYIRVDFLGKGPAKAAAAEITAELQKYGIELPKVEKEQDTEEVSSEEFKPSVIFRQDPVDQLDVKQTPDGISVEGVEIKSIGQQEVAQIEDDIVDLARQKLQAEGRELTPEHEQRLREYVQKRVAATNHNIEYLQQAVQGAKGGRLPAYQFQGEEGSKLIATRLTEVVDRHVPPGKKQEAAKAAIEAMQSARTPKEFNAAWAEFSKAVKGTPVGKNAKYIAETATALRVVALGGVALIPTSDSFQLADVISIKRSPITGEVDITQILVDVEQEIEITAAGSVKVGKGAGSGNKPKIIHSEFDTGTVDNVDCSNVRQDLMSLCDISSRNMIFQPTEDGEPTPQAKSFLMGHISTYGSMIKEYYGLDQNMSDDDLYTFLSYGLSIACVDGKPQPTPDGMNGEPYAEARSPNGGQWRAWSVLGKITEAIHNRTVTQQHYHTVRYNGGVKVADGIRTLSRMESQHVKKKTKRDEQGRQKPDQAQNAFTIPASIEETRNGNPCTQ